MKQLGKFPQRDFDVLVHGDLKWKQFAKHVDWVGKRVLDVGCHIGLVAIRAKAKGAKFVWGVDLRKDVVDFNNAIAIRFIPVKKRALTTKFIQRGLDNIADIEAEIVLCLGVIHKFPDGVYQDMVKNLCVNCKETLVIETCFDYSENQDLNVTTYPKDQTLWPHFTRVSPPYLKRLLNENGFKVEKRIPSVVYALHQRETWIAKRKKA